MEIIPYSREFDEQVRALCKLPVSGNISLALEREPDYITGAAVQCIQPEVYICVNPTDNRVYGVFNVGFRQVYYAGAARQIRYLCDLRIHPDMQGSSLLFRIIRFAQALGLTSNGLPAQTIVFGDNRRMLEMIDRARKMKNKRQLPVYHYAGKYVSQLIGFRQTSPASDEYTIRCATAADIPNMQTFLDAESRQINFFPVCQFDALGTPYYSGLQIGSYFLAFQGDELVGICGVWDQSSFKQTRITGYSPVFKAIRPFYNLFAKLTGGNALPPAGSVLKYLNLHTVLVKDRNPAVFKSLVLAILNKFRHAGYDYLLCGLDENDPLSAVWKSFKHRREITGRYFLVNYETEISEEFFKPWFYLEAARI